MRLLRLLIIVFKSIKQYKERLCINYYKEMCDTSFNIVELIENNPITRLSNTYHGNLLNKIKTKFADHDQQMFVASFYCYLNYNSKDDFVIDLDNVWKWLGFSSKQTSKVLLEKHFMNDIDYKKSLMAQHKQSPQMKGGHNKEIFMLSVRTFKLFCLKAGTKKAEQIHEYYINLEDTLHEVGGSTPTPPESSACLEGFT